MVDRFLRKPSWALFRELVILDMYNSGSGSNHTYQTPVCSYKQSAFKSTFCVIWCPSRQYPGTIAFSNDIFYIEITVHYLHLQTIQSALDMLTKVQTNNFYNMTLICCLTGVLDPIKSFNPSKCAHISFKADINTSYNLNEQEILKLDFHCDLGVIISNDLSWRTHYTNMLSKAYKTLGLICHKFISSHSKTKLYVSLFRSNYILTLFPCMHMVAISFNWHQ